MSDGRVVMDASALLALVLSETGAEIVAEHLTNSAVSAVNFSEVAAKLAEHGMPDEAIHATLLELDVEIHPFDAGQALAAGMLRRTTKAFGLSLGDRACLALAQELHAVAFTTDRIWAKLSLPGVQVRIIR